MIAWEGNTDGLYNYSGYTYSTLYYWDNDPAGSGGITANNKPNLPTTSGTITSYNGISTSGQGVVPIYDTILATTQTANYNSGTAKTLFTPTVSGSVYRVNVWEAITRAASSSSTMPSITIGWTDSQGVARTETIVSTSGANTTGTAGWSNFMFDTNGSTAVTLTSASYASSGATSMEYTLIAALEQLI